MFLTSGYVLIVRVLVKSDFLHTFRSGFSPKSCTFLRLGWHVLRDFRLDVLRQHLRNASFIDTVMRKTCVHKMKSAPRGLPRAGAKLGPYA